MRWLTKVDLKLIDWWTRRTHTGGHRANGLSTMQRVAIWQEAVRNVQAGKVVLG